MKKKKRSKPLLVPEAEEKMNELRYEITKKLGYLVINAEDWWSVLTPMQKSEINGIVTKMMVEKAKQDIMMYYYKDK